MGLLLKVPQKGRVFHHLIHIVGKALKNVLAHGILVGGGMIKESYPYE